jgi:hypothetical protein
MASSSGAFDVSQHQTYRIDAMDFMHFGCGSAALKEASHGSREALLRRNQSSVTMPSLANNAC